MADYRRDKIARHEKALRDKAKKDALKEVREPERTPKSEEDIKRFKEMMKKFQEKNQINSVNNRITSFLWFSDECESAFAISTTNSLLGFQIHFAPEPKLSFKFIVPSALLN